MKLFNALKKYTKYLVASLTVVFSVAAITPMVSMPGNPPECSVCNDDENCDPPRPTETIPLE